VYFSASVRIGYYHDPKDHLEISHVLEHMIRMYTSNKYRSGKKTQILMEMEGAYQNAYTARTYTTYHMTCMSDSFDFLLDMMLTALKDFRIDTGLLRQEKEAVISELNTRHGNNIWNDATEASLKTMFPHIPDPSSSYKERIKAVKSMTANDLIRYFKKHYRPENMCFIVVGDFDYQSVIRKIGSVFSTRRIHTDAIVPYPIASSFIETPFQGKQTIHVPNKKSATANIDYTWLLRNKVHFSDLHKYCALGLIMTHLTSGFSSVLMTRLRTDLGYIYSVSDVVDVVHNGLGYISIICETQRQATVEQIYCVYICFFLFSCVVVLFITYYHRKMNTSFACKIFVKK
jgi:predicted Zn-dependent peptidase